ncbi:MAG: glycosyltransferase family 4 protein [Aquabacterium sp.]|uniref:glycosyltransferase family 4 protein n=1 Tax=Aquabacterium sp. TaxID=1872578 RepID=UPI0025BDB3C1|nr:glycosyltransferase family 4 protein [Aquabacterium sp.]MBI5924988.1 glycosyltransferase family 4 protein [Aquabacterium sp.]
MSDTSLVLSNHGLRHSGGIERYLLTLVDSLHARGLRPTVIAHKFDKSIAEYAWVNPIHIRTWGLGGALRDRWFDARLRRLKARHQWFPLIALSQTSAADIAICGGTHPGYLAAINQTPSWKDKLAIALEAKHLGHASVVIAHSELMARQVKQFYGVEPSKVDVLYPPVDTQRFHPVSAQRKQALREQLGLPPDRCVFLLASTGHARKGLDLLVEALGHSDLPVLLVVAGRPVDVQAPNLRYLGYRSDIEDVYRAVDCTVMASRYEPFGLVGVETVLCGTPLVGAEGMGCMEVLQGDGVIPFKIEAATSQQASLHVAIAQVLSRWRAGTLQVADPLKALRYDPTVDAHLQALLRHVDQLRARQTGRDA